MLYKSTLAAKIAKKLLRRNSVKAVVEHEGIRLDTTSAHISQFMKEQLNSEYEPTELALLKKYLQPEDRVLEIGVGVGLLGLFARKQIGVERYLGVEANPHLMSVIRSNCALNDCSLDVMNIAVSDSSGTASFKLSSNFWSSSLYERSTTVETIEVPSLTLQDLCADLEFSPSFLLIDMEGGEEVVSFKLGKQPASILIELHPHIVGSERTAKVISDIFEAGYKLQEYRGKVYYFTLR